MTDIEDIEDIDFDALSETKSNTTNANKKKKKSPGDFPSLFADLFMKINWKIAFFLFILFIIINSDIFIDKCLGKIPGAVTNMTPTGKGTVVQAACLVLFYIILDGIISAGLI
jgi:hypothetical protein